MQEAQFIQNRVPLEHSKILNKDKYKDEVSKYIDHFTTKNLSDFDIKILKEITNDDYNIKYDPVQKSNSHVHPLREEIKKAFKTCRK